MSNTERAVLLVAGLCIGLLVGTGIGIIIGYPRGYDKAMTDAGNFLVNACTNVGTFTIYAHKANFICAPAP